MSSFSFSILDTVVFWTIEGLDLDSDADIELVTGEKAILNMLHTIPIIMLLIEYPFNMIPINLRLFPFDCLIVSLYAPVTILYQVIQKEPVYGPMDWFDFPGQATLIFLTGFLLEIAICFVLWFVTEKIKLPYYNARIERKSESLISGLSNSGSVFEGEDNHLSITS